MDGLHFMFCLLRRLFQVLKAFENALEPPMKCISGHRT